MTHATHTPGPWELGSPPSYHGWPIWANRRDSLVAQVETATDARLIAEAPAMLAALRWAERELAGFQNVTGTPDSKLTEIRTILARIKGAGA